MVRKTDKKLLEKYPKYCPKCKIYQHDVYLVCPDCQTPLIDAQIAYKRKRRRAFMVNILFIFTLILATYGIQKGERKYYNQSAYFLVTGRFHDSKVEFWKAFSANPFCKFSSSTFEKIKYKITHRTIVYEIR
ncbi:MAG: hypothetical protein PHT53_01715 [Candidatus Omnitrophica bacterium]|nr:hypothetical protein [Candidatus Omnitrophota bacterium]